MRLLLLVLFAFPILSNTSTAQDWSALETRWLNASNQLSGLLSSLASSTGSAQSALDDLTARKNAAILAHPECFPQIQYAEEAVSNLETGIAQARDGSGFGTPGEGFDGLYDEAYEYESNLMCTLWDDICNGGNQTLYNLASSTMTNIESIITSLQNEMNAKMAVWGPVSTSLIDDATYAVESLEGGC